MVFEQIITTKWLNTRHPYYLIILSLFLGFSYTLFGILVAQLIFPSDAGLMSVAFTAIMLVPSLMVLIRSEESIEIRENKFHLRQLIKDHSSIVKIYISLFFGILIAYSVYTLVLPVEVSSNVFDPQLESAGLSGYATNPTVFSKIFTNNLLVFVVSFLVSFIYGSGAILFIAWNASVWGSVISFLAKSSTGAFAEYVNLFFVQLVQIFPHMFLEALAYILAAIVGGVVSRGVIQERFFSKNFHHIVTDALILLFFGIVVVFIGAYIEVTFFF